MAYFQGDGRRVLEKGQADRMWRASRQHLGAKSCLPERRSDAAPCLLETDAKDGKVNVKPRKPVSLDVEKVQPSSGGAQPCRKPAATIQRLASEADQLGSRLRP